MYLSQSFHRAVALSVLLGVSLFLTPAFCDDTIIPGFDTLEGDYVLVHGYRFAEMERKSDSELIWLPQSTLDDPSVTQQMDLALSIRTDEPDGYGPKGLLKSVGSIKLYERFSSYMQQLQQQGGNFQYHEFVYDWRRTDAVSAAALVDFLQNIYDNNGNKPINVLSHSLGGPITLLAIHSKPELFAGSIFVGGAFKGGAYIYGELKKGIANLEAGKPPLQDAASCFTMRPTYTIIPPTSVFVDSNNQPINIDPFDVNVWQQSTWSVLNDDTPRARQLGTADQRFKYLMRTLMVSRQVYDDIQPRENFDYPPFVALTSQSFTAVTGYPMAKNADGLWEISYDKPIMGPGDQILPIESTVPTGFPHELILTQTSHTAQFENLNEIGQALAKLHDMQHS